MSKYVNKIVLSNNFIIRYQKWDGTSMHQVPSLKPSFDGNININKIREFAGHEDERTSLSSYCFDRATSVETEKS